MSDLPAGGDDASRRSAYWRLRVRRHVLLGATTLLVGVPLTLAVPSDFLWRKLAVASAFLGLAYLGAALLIGPVAVLRGRRMPVSMDRRRDVGIWAALVSLVHVVIGFQVHFRDAPNPYLQYFVDRLREGGGWSLRTDLVGVANWTGLGAALVLVVLLAISNDVALRRLGVRVWKRVQRFAYLALVLTAAHGVVYQVRTRRPWPAVLLLWLMLAVVVGGQVAGLRRRRR